VHNDWVALLGDSGAKLPDGTSLEAFATELEETCAGAYPTTAMMQRAVRAQSDLSAPLATVVSLNPDVDLLSLDLTADSDDLSTVDLGTLTEEQRQSVTMQLRTMQRVLTVAEHPTRARKLMDAGYHHATRIALATQAELVEKTGLTE